MSGHLCRSGPVFCCHIFKLADLRSVAGPEDELHEASIERNKLLHRAVHVISGLQTDTDSLLAAADLHSDSAFDLPGRTSAPQFRITLGSTSPFKLSKTTKEQTYEEAALSAAQQRNSLLQRAYNVISNLQVSGLINSLSYRCQVQAACTVETMLAITMF